MGGTKVIVMNPFPSMVLSPGDKKHLQMIANAFLAESIRTYDAYVNLDKRHLNEQQWKSLKTKETLRLYIEREVRTTANGNASIMSEASEQAGTPVSLCVGTLNGRMEDVLYGTVSATAEEMCCNASYVDDLSGAALLDTVVEPTVEEPLQTLGLKWVELNLPLHSNKRDFVFMEATGFTHLLDGERVGYRLMYSIGYPQTPELPNRVRASVNVFFLFRQRRDRCVEMFASGVVANGSSIESLLVVPSAMKLFTALKFAHCGEMKKLTWLMHRRYALDKQRGAPVGQGECINCGVPIGSKLFGKFGRSRDSCKLCHQLVCGTCRVKKRLTFVTLEMTFENRKTAFCPLCIREALELDAAGAARAQVAGHKSQFEFHSGTDYSFISSSDSERTV
ncbi:hypothetical protein PsorP6_017510 [Peronosclerospora sorghi]|uniref:Uncharacterized protein n=1 Tax=Peronosclerospora sorghi TaxID=230839 RepID=A0ACC0WKM8_9STRA|nr:hypothetical protein PsorP6_017510 [Peronosclerospora sorghi]